METKIITIDNLICEVDDAKHTLYTYESYLPYKVRELLDFQDYYDELETAEETLEDLTQCETVDSKVIENIQDLLNECRSIYINHNWDGLL